MGMFVEMQCQIDVGVEPFKKCAVECARLFSYYPLL
jgi:hypothetical protein